MKRTIVALAVLAVVLVPLATVACPYHQAAGIINDLYGNIPGFSRLGPDQGGLNHYQMQVSINGQSMLIQGSLSVGQIVDRVEDFLQDNVDQGPTYEG